MSEPLRILVTGAGGMLAHDLVPALRAQGHVVTPFGRYDLDITEPSECVAAVTGHDLVVNSAAWTAVDKAESNEGEAFWVNAIGAANLARAADRSGARILHVSTDYVFDGEADEPYVAEHPASPHTAYGRGKTAGEWAVRALCPDAWIVRTAWLYGEGGPNFVRTMMGLACEQDVLEVVADQVGQPTWTKDLADLIVRLIEVNPPAGTYHGTSSGQTTWHGFTRAIFEDTGLDPARVRAVSSDKHPRPAPRPKYSVLSHATLQAVGIEPIRDWRSALAAYLGAPEPATR